MVNVIVVILVAHSEYGWRETLGSTGPAYVTNYQVGLTWCLVSRLLDWGDNSSFALPSNHFLSKT